MLKHSHEARSEAFNIVPLGFYVDIYGDMKDTGSECLMGILIRAGLPSRSCWGLFVAFNPLHVLICSWTFGTYRRQSDW